MLLLSGVLLAAGSFAGGATQRMAAESINLHDLSLRVLVDGELIMTPNVQLLPTRTAYVSIGSPGEVVYTLTLDIIEHVADAPADATGLQMVLWRGGAGGGEMLLDSVMVIDSRTIARAASEGRSPSVRIGGSTKASVEIELVSHAVLESDATVVATQATCKTARALSASSSDAVVPNARTAARTHFRAVVRTGAVDAASVARSLDRFPQRPTYSVHGKGVNY